MGMDEQDYRDLEEIGSEAMREVGEASSRAMREVGNALAKIDFDKIARSIEKTGHDVARQLSNYERRDDTSPYVLCDSYAVTGARAQEWGGVVLLILFPLPFLVIAFLAAFVSSLMALVFVAIAVAGLVFGVKLVSKGRKNRQFAVTMQRIDRVLGDRQSIPLIELAREASVPTTQLEPILSQAISTGVIPEGHLGFANQQRTLFLTDEAWRMEHGNEENAWVVEPTDEDESDPAISEDARAVLEASRTSVADIRAAASQVKDASVRASLESIASKSEELCAYVARHPETASQFKHAATYYLPTTAKLASSYVELEGRASGPQMEGTLAELRTTLAQVDDALSKLADELVQGQSIDLKSDMEVMRTMLRQDGLSDQDGLSGSQRPSKK